MLWSQPVLLKLQLQCSLERIKCGFMEQGYSDSKSVEFVLKRSGTCYNLTLHSEFDFLSPDNMSEVFSIRVFCQRVSPEHLG